MWLLYLMREICEAGAFRAISIKFPVTGGDGSSSELEAPASQVFRIKE
jgi:hypothetical protein